MRLSSREMVQLRKKGCMALESLLLMVKVESLYTLPLNGSFNFKTTKANLEIACHHLSNWSIWISYMIV